MYADAPNENQCYKVVINHEEQYSIWPEEREDALGWTDEGFSGNKQACLDHIEEVWTDMRPLSLRKKWLNSNPKHLHDCCNPTLKGD